MHATEKDFMLNEQEILKLFESLQQKHGQLPDDTKTPLDECAEPSLSVEGIRILADEFELPLDVVRKLSVRQYFWLSMELDEKSTRELTFEEEERCNDTLAEMHKAGGIIQWLEQRQKKKVAQQPSPLLPRDSRR